MPILATIRPRFKTATIRGHRTRDNTKDAVASLRACETVENRLTKGRSHATMMGLDGVGLVVARTALMCERCLESLCDLRMDGYEDGLFVFGNVWKVKVGLVDDIFEIVSHLVFLI